ncbi:MAG: ectoine utilization protein EutC [Kiloniellales bacterium]
MPSIRILTEAELRTAVPLDLAAVDCVEAAFRALAGGEVVMPPILSMDLHHDGGEFDAKTAYVPGLESFAFKMSTAFYGNVALGLPSLSGLMVVFSTKNGLVEAVLLDNGYLTDVRTAAAGAVVAKYLARDDASTAAILGTGLQARLQLEALTLVRSIERATIWGRDLAKAEVLAQSMTENLGIAVSASADAAEAVAEADIIVTTTPAEAPILKADWLRAGQHVTAMGCDAPIKNELDPHCLTKADIYVPDRLSQTRSLGELRVAIESGLIPADRDFAELGSIIVGAAPGRRTADEITLADLTGTGVQDTAIATLARERAAAAGAGQSIES